jgi:hypothetical protein
MYRRIVEAKGGRAAGFFDVLAWQVTRLPCIEQKGTDDRPNENEQSWLQAAVDARVQEHGLLHVVHG